MNGWSIGLVVGELAAAGLLVAALIRASRRVARRTQRTSSSVATATTLLTFVVMAGVAAGLYAIPSVHDWLIRPSQAGSVTIFGWLLAWWGAAQLVSMLLIAVALPPAHRFAGSQRSRAHYGLLINSTRVSTVVIPAGLLLLGEDWATALKAFAACATLTGYLSYRKSRVQPIDARAELEHDSRPSVLYLRPFEEDVELFAERSMTWRQAWSEYLRLNAGDLSSWYYQTFEEFFAEAVRAELGPFIALGNPADRIAPQGASRVYLTDTSWQGEFTDLLARAGGVVATCRLSPSTAWEISTLRQLGLVNKLFLVTAPSLPAGRRRHPGSALKRALLAGSLDKSAAPRRRPWATIVTDYAGLGLVLPADDAGPGAVLGFTDEGRATLLSSTAKTPEQYVRAMRRGLVTA